MPQNVNSKMCLELSKEIFDYLYKTVYNPYRMCTADDYLPLFLDQNGEILILDREDRLLNYLHTHGVDGTIISITKKAEVFTGNHGAPKILSPFAFPDEYDAEKYYQPLVEFSLSDNLHSYRSFEFAGYLYPDIDHDIAWGYVYDDDGILMILVLYEAELKTLSIEIADKTMRSLGYYPR